MNPSLGTQFEENRKAAPRYVYSGEGDSKRLLPKDTHIDVEKPFPAEAAILSFRAVATQEEAEEAKRTAMLARMTGQRLILSA